MLRIDYDSLAVLAAIVREGSFEAAAKSINVTQSAVSQRIRQLEEKVGAVLVVRGRPCVPTEVGLQLFRHVEQVELLQQEMNERMLSLLGSGDVPAATVRISVNNDSLATWFPSVIKRATVELGIRVEILPDDQEHTEMSLRSGDALAIVTALETPVQGCRRMSLGSMNYIAVASKELFNSKFADGVSLDTLRGSICLAFNRKDTIQEQWMTLCFGEAVPVSTNFVPSYEGYIACCLNGTGWGIVPKTEAINALLKHGDLVELNPGKAVKVSLHWQTSTQSSDILNRLGEIVQEESAAQLFPDKFRPN
jgi:LysR family transcriptional regulator (chromosome initiation inhibitor)